jgi:hypothetical protein
MPNKKTEPPLPLHRRTEDSRAKPPLGGGPTATTTTARAISGAKASLEVTTTTVVELSSCLPVASFMWSVSTVVSDQNGCLSTSRSCRSFQIRK